MELGPLLILIIVLGVILALVLWAINELPLPGPLKPIARAVAIAIVVIILISQALPMAGVSI